MKKKLKINYAEAEKQLKLNNYYHIPSSNKTIYRADNQNYIFDTEKDFLGKGSYGKVYLAHKCDFETHYVDMAKEFAIKVLYTAPLIDFNEKSKQEFLRLQPPFKSHIEQEIAYLRSYGEPVTNLIEAFSFITLSEEYKELENTRCVEQPFYFFVMPYYGNPLGDFIKDTDNNTYRFIVNSKLSALDFSQRINLIWQGCMYLDSYHRSTVLTGGVIIHKDIKPQNVLLQIKRNKKSNDEFHLIFVDYGIATEMTDENIQTSAGSFISAAPELIRNDIASTKSDVYSFGTLILILLNAKNPYEYRQKNSLRISFNGFLENIVIPGPFSNIIKSLLETFINKTLEEEPSFRATTNECVAFFTLLKKYTLLAKYSLNKNALPLQDYITVIAKLIILCEELWEQPVDIITTQKNLSFWSTFDFEAAPEFCTFMVWLYQQEKFNLVKCCLMAETLTLNKAIQNQIGNILTKTNIKKSFTEISQLCHTVESIIAHENNNNYDHN